MGNGNFHALHCYVFRYYYNVIFAQHIFIYIQLNLTALKWFLWFMVFNATFNNISVISWRSVSLVEETGEPIHGIVFVYRNYIEDQLQFNILLFLQFLVNQIPF
jgi:hypothetical protein